MYFGTKMITTCSPMIGQVFDTMIVASIDQEWLSESRSWKMLEIVLSQLNKTFKTWTERLEFNEGFK